MSVDNSKIAVLIPCYNEGLTIRSVVNDFKKSLPGASIYVFDNNSDDDTKKNAIKSGAIVREVTLQGKGNVVRRMFADVEADIYVMVDGDATYHAASANKMIDHLLKNDLDMVVGCRTEKSKNNNNYRFGHRFGNKMLTGSVSRMFGGQFTDMLSGYRVFSRRFVKSFPVASRGFEIETELTVHTLELGLPYGEVQTPYEERPEGSESKLSTYKDGLKISRLIVSLYASERPIRFWGLIGAALLVLAIGITIPIILEFIETNEVPRFPSLMLSTSLAVAGFLAYTVGLILSTVTRGRREAKQLAYLAAPIYRIYNEKK